MVSIFSYGFWNLYVQYPKLNDWLALILLERKEYFAFSFLYFSYNLFSSCSPTLVNVAYVLFSIWIIQIQTPPLHSTPTASFPLEKKWSSSLQSCFSENQGEIFLILIIGAGPVGQWTKSANFSSGFIASMSLSIES